MKRIKMWREKLLILAGAAVAAVWLMACGDMFDTTVSEQHGISEAGNGTADIEGDSTLEIHYLDVGQGDATLILCDGHAMLIDAGNNNKGTAVWSYLKSQNVETLDYVIGTHPDADHIGGLDVIITKFDCSVIFLTEETKDTNTYRDVVDAMKYKSYPRTAPVVGDTYVLGAAEFTIVAPSEMNTDSNDNSIAIILQHGENSFYFEGDAGEAEEASICNRTISDRTISDSNLDIAAKVYKIGHHGSKTSTSDEILAQVLPEYAIISVGDNSYGHPNAEVLNKLRAKGIAVFRTDEQGTIVATSDGKQITWNMSPDDSWKAGEPGAAQDITDQKAVTDTQGVVDTHGEVDTGSSTAGTADIADVDIMVHITASGAKYHQAGCGYLKTSDYEVTLAEAKEQGLTPCSKCKPPE